MFLLLWKVVVVVIGGGVIVIVLVLIIGLSGNDGLEGVSYILYKDIVGVWIVCYGYIGKDIMFGKMYIKVECKVFLNKDFVMVVR